MIKNIVFDWSGVVKDSLEDHLFIVNSMFEDLGGPQITLQELQENWVQPYMLFYNKYLPALTLEQEQQAYRRAISKISGAKFVPGMPELIKDFKNHQIQMVVLSSDFPDTVLHEIKSFDLENIFLDVVTNVHEKEEGLKKIIEDFKFVLGETIFIGDSNHEIEAGKSLGVKTGAVTWGYGLRKNLEKLKPDYLFNNPSEIKNLVKK